MHGPCLSRCTEDGYRGRWALILRAMLVFCLNPTVFFTVPFGVENLTHFSKRTSAHSLTTVSKESKECWRPNLVADVIGQVVNYRPLASVVLPGSSSPTVGGLGRQKVALPSPSSAPTIHAELLIADFFSPESRLYRGRQCHEGIKADASDVPFPPEK